MGCRKGTYQLPKTQRRGQLCRVCLLGKISVQPIHPGGRALNISVNLAPLTFLLDFHQQPPRFMAVVRSNYHQLLFF